MIAWTTFDDTACAAEYRTHSGRRPGGEYLVDLPAGDRVEVLAAISKFARLDFERHATWATMCGKSGPTATG